jgi:hypothetical protein
MQMHQNRVFISLVSSEKGWIQYNLHLTKAFPSVQSVYSLNQRLSMTVKCLHAEIVERIVRVHRLHFFVKYFKVDNGHCILQNSYYLVSACLTCVNKVTVETVKYYFSLCFVLLVAVSLVKPKSSASGMDNYFLLGSLMSLLNMIVSRRCWQEKSYS